jgi:hypothetical protein
MDAEQRAVTLLLHGCQMCALSWDAAADPAWRVIVRRQDNFNLRFYNLGRHVHQWRLDEVSSYSRRKLVEVDMDPRLIHLIPETMFVQYLLLLTR